VSAVRKAGELVEYVTDIIRRRVRCSWELCRRRNWTVYEEAAYPHRLFDLVVVISAVSTAVFGKTSLTASAVMHDCSRDSVRRWKRWVGELADPAELMRACTRLDADGVPGSFVSAELPRAARVLHLFDRLADLLVERGVHLTELRWGLARLLHHHLCRFGEVFYLTRSSPPLRADLAGARF
jgi:hypothetical protein